MKIDINIEDAGDLTRGEVLQVVHEALGEVLQGNAKQEIPRALLPDEDPGRSEIVTAAALRVLRNEPKGAAYWDDVMFVASEMRRLEAKKAGGRKVEDPPAGMAASPGNISLDEVLTEISNTAKAANGKAETALKKLRRNPSDLQSLMNRVEQVTRYVTRLATAQLQTLGAMSATLDEVKKIEQVSH